MKPNHRNPLDALRGITLSKVEEERILRNLRTVMQAEEDSLLLGETKRKFSWSRAQSVAVGLAAVLLVGSFCWGVARVNHKSPTPASRLQPSVPKLQQEATKTPVVLHSFSASRDWHADSLSRYLPGILTEDAPSVPSSYEQSVRPQQGIANIMISSHVGKAENASNWKQEIQFNSDSFKINGQIYTVPGEYAKQPMFVLPIDHGIVWANGSRSPGSLSDVRQALQGETDIYYTPYQTHGGSLATGEQLIAQLPHRWLGIDGPVLASAWTGWLPKENVEPAVAQGLTPYHLQFSQNSQLTSATPINGAIPGWPTLFMRDLSKPAYYKTPHYAASVGSMTRTNGGLVLEVDLLDATESGRNAGLSDATYYWSERTRKWTPLAQNYNIQTVGSWTDTGSDGVYWIQPSPVGDGSGNELDVTEMHFDPASLKMESIWIGHWIDGASFVDANSWVAVLANARPTSTSATSKKWTVYTP